MAGAVAQELTEVVLAWPRLSDADKAGILVIIRDGETPDGGRAGR